MKFTSNVHDWGEGIVVIKNGFLNGADSGYVYRGKVTAAHNEINMIAEIVQWNGAVSSVFGTVGAFKLALNGKLESRKKFEVKGTVMGMDSLKISIVGTYLSTVE
ncbi:hypothetical protein HNQ50_000578 [Silvimonas terrae]|uniref:T3SS negative regulator,GrlR n=1 Tax=Silvimonas terrae TaxID=300266 RepID=A0A840RBF4_9NEIS|nr:hypothetical protein [Silvimonas terrae]